MIPKSLQRLVKAIVIAIPLVSLGTQSALSSDPRDFTLINNGDSAVISVYISDTGLTTWGPDILGVDTLPVGKSAEISFPSADPNRCVYDIKITSEAGDGVINGINLCTIRTVTFR